MKTLPIEKQILALSFFLAGALGCSTIPSFDYSKEPDPRKHEFVIGAADALKITVWKNPDLSGDARVRPSKGPET